MILLNDPKYYNIVKIWILLSIILVSLLILVGGLTRLTNSGLSITENFRNIGVDSIDYVSVVMEIEEYYDIELVEAEVEWHKINTIEKLAEIVNEQIV